MLRSEHLIAPLWSGERPREVASALPYPGEVLIAGAGQRQQAHFKQRVHKPLREPHTLVEVAREIGDIAVHRV